MIKLKIVRVNAEYAVKAHDAQVRRKTARYGKAIGTFMNNPGYFVSRRDKATGQFVKAV